MSQNKDAKKPEIIQYELQKGFEWTTQHLQVVLVVSFLFIAGGGGYTLWSYLETSKESAWQEKYYLAEKAYNDKKQETPEILAKKKESTTPDLPKNYDEVIKAFEAIVKEAPKTKAAQMAALNLTDLYSSVDQSIATMNQIEAYLKPGEILSSLIHNKLAGLYVDKNECEKAIKSWQAIVDDSKVSFMHDDAKLNQALCYEKLGKKDQAVSIYEILQKTKSDQAVGKTAAKYLKLLKINAANHVTGS